MKLLFDNNLSYKLVERLADVHPESAHVAQVGLDSATDDEVWDHARMGGYCLVSKDSDFNDLLTARGFPPKVIWLRLGNCTTQMIVDALRKHHAEVMNFANDADAGLLEIQ